MNVLLIGIDSGVGRNTALTDTMIVASLDPVGKTVSMASIPRDMVDVPLPDGRTFRGKINSLVSYVRWHPGKFPGAKDGQSVLAAALGQLLDLKIDMWAQVNLPGFVDLVDAVGGITSTSPTASATTATRSTGSRGSTSPPADITSTASMPSAMRGSARRPARATSLGPPASRRSSPRSATGS